MDTIARPLVYAIGLDGLIACAVEADLPDAAIQWLRPLSGAAVPRRVGPRPDLLLLDLSSTYITTELAAARAAWGERLVIVGLDRQQPYARVWQRPEVALLVEIGPGFLDPFLPRERMSGVTAMDDKRG